MAKLENCLLRNRQTNFISDLLQTGSMWNTNTFSKKKKQKRPKRIRSTVDLGGGKSANEISTSFLDLLNHMVSAWRVQLKWFDCYFFHNRILMLRLTLFLKKVSIISSTVWQRCVATEILCPLLYWSSVIKIFINFNSFKNKSDKTKTTTQKKYL